MNSPTDPMDRYERDQFLKAGILTGWEMERALFDEHYTALRNKLAAKFRNSIDHVEAAIAATFAQCFNSSPAASGSLRAWKGLNKDGEKSELESWLLPIAANKVKELLTQDARRNHEDDGMETIERHAAPSASGLKIKLPADELHKLAGIIEKQGRKTPRILILERLAALGVTDVNAACLWGFSNSHANKEMKKLQPRRMAWMQRVCGETREAALQLSAILNEHPELMSGRAPGTAATATAAATGLTDAEGRELARMATTAIDSGRHASLARGLWKKKETLQKLCKHLGKLAADQQVSVQDIPPGKKPEALQMMISTMGLRLEKRMGAASFRDELARVLELLLQQDFPQEAALAEDEEARQITLCFTDLMAATRWQSRLWQHEEALDFLASSMCTTRKAGQKKKAVPVARHQELMGKSGLLQHELHKAADYLLPMDFALLIDESCRVLHTALLKSCQAHGATLWLLNSELRALQAVFNPAEEGVHGIVARIQPLSEGIISWVHKTGRGVYFSESGGVTGHPGNHKPHAHARDIDRRTGKQTQAMIALPFQCCGASRGVLTLVRTGESAAGFGEAERMMLESFGTLLGGMIERSLIGQLLS